MVDLEDCFSAKLPILLAKNRYLTAKAHLYPLLLPTVTVTTREVKHGLFRSSAYLHLPESLWLHLQNPSSAATARAHRED
jgi:hypothetical protein